MIYMLNSAGREIGLSSMGSKTSYPMVNNGKISPDVFKIYDTN